LHGTQRINITMENEEYDTNDQNDDIDKKVTNISVYVIPLPPKYHQYKIGSVGNIIPLEKCQLLTKIDTLEFSK